MVVECLGVTIKIFCPLDSKKGLLYSIVTMGSEESEGGWVA